MGPKKETKGKGDTKGKGKAPAKDSKDGEEKAGKSGKLKPATSINVRHILCEKHSKKEEALTKLRDGTKFDEVAREFSEDKARQGECSSYVTHPVRRSWLSLGTVLLVIVLRRAR
jgi:peptidyl-prolyl cis-trans isomerase NIMA-interacting 4